MSELGIFIDESGIIDGKNNSNLTDLYIVSFIFHNKINNIQESVKQFEDFLTFNKLEPNFPIHSMPLIRQQKPYSELNWEMRRKLFYNFFQFMRKLKLQYKTFIFDKKYFENKQSIKLNLENYIEQMISEYYDYIIKFDEIVVYYDKGQGYLSRVLYNAFSKNLINCRFKEDVCQSDYRILQCADMVCTLELIKQRKLRKEYIKSIDKFFGSGNKYNKNYAKVFNNMELT